MKKLFCSASLLFLIILESHSQFNLQPYGSFVRNMNRYFKGNTFGGGIRAEFGDEGSRISKYFGLGYNIPIKTTYELEAEAYSSFTSPDYVPVTATYSQPMYRAESGIRYYIAGESQNFEGINVFANVGAELIVTLNKPTYSDFDRENYTLGFSGDVNEDGSEKVAINAMIAAGLGIEKNIGTFNLFLHAGIALPATQLGNSDISENIESFSPTPLNVSLGIKIPIGNN